MGKEKNSISDELLAAFLDGNTTVEETQMVLDAAAKDESLQELIRLSAEVDEDLDGIEFNFSPQEKCPLPMLERAAKNTVDNLCAIRCEGYALRHFGIEITDELLEQDAKQKGWLHEDGMPLHLIGWSSSVYGSYVSRRYDCSINDISKALRNENVVIVVIDNSELNLPPREARKKDVELGKLPNHAVVITSLDQKKNTIDIFNPGFPDLSKTYPIDVFIEAWNDSYNYLVTISNYNKYEPHPLDLSDVELEEELIELREAIAENAHEVWAHARKLEGWTYGKERDDAKKLHPDMLPYHALPECEKKYDRQMAIETIKLVKKLGWDLVKRNKKH